MDSQDARLHPMPVGSSAPGIGPHLAGTSRQAAMIAWGLITLVSLLSFAFSVYILNVWDRVPAAQQTRFFPDTTPQDIQSHTDYQNSVLQAGLSLSGYALIFTVARLVGGLSLFLLGYLLLRRYNHHLMAVLMAVLLSVLGAAGIWSNPLFGWTLSIAPWMKYPVAVLGWLLWCGVIVIYTFPDGRFAPRWMPWLAVLVVPLAFLLAFNIDIFLNPDNWPSPLYLLPSILFVGGGFVAIVYRYWSTTDSEPRRRMRWYVLSLSLLLVAYFVDFFVNQAYPSLSGQDLIRGNHAAMLYVLAYEPIWYALEVFFALGLALSVFRHHLLEDLPDANRMHPLDSGL